jgi:hypothetical protein
VEKEGSQRDSRISNHVWPVAKEEFKQSTISLKKAGVVYDLIEKI